MGISGLVSIIIPAYNSGRWVTEAIESVLAQTYKAIEVIVVDDGSTDDTSRRVEPYKTRGVDYVYQANQGVSAARNTGLARATGDYVAFLDADDIWHPLKLELQQNVFTAQSDLAVLGSNVFAWPGPCPTSIQPTDCPAISEVHWDRLVIRNTLTTSSMVVRRSMLDALGSQPFDIQLQGPEDYDLWLRLAEQYRIAIIDLPLTGYRFHSGGLGAQAKVMKKGLARIRDKLDARGVWKARDRRILRRKARAYFHYTCAISFAAAGDNAATMAEVLKSGLQYPLPFSAKDEPIPLARLRVLFNSMMRIAGLRRQSSKGAT